MWWIGGLMSLFPPSGMSAHIIRVLIHYMISDHEWHDRWTENQQKLELGIRVFDVRQFYVYRHAPLMWNMYHFFFVNKVSRTYLAECSAFRSHADILDGLVYVLWIVDRCLNTRTVVIKVNIGGVWNCWTRINGLYIWHIILHHEIVPFWELRQKYCMKCFLRFLLFYCKVQDIHFEQKQSVKSDVQMLYIF